MVFGTLATMIVFVLLGRMVTEQRAVARSLAETRAYWPLWESTPTC